MGNLTHTLNYTSSTSTLIKYIGDLYFTTFIHIAISIRIECGEAGHASQWRKAKILQEFILIYFQMEQMHYLRSI